MPDLLFPLDLVREPTYGVALPTLRVVSSLSLNPQESPRRRTQTEVILNPVSNPSRSPNNPDYDGDVDKW